MRPRTRNLAGIWASFASAPGRRGVLACAALAMALGLGPSAAADVLERRGGAPPIAGRLEFGDEGVTVLSELGAKQTISWDRVRSVRTQTPPSDLARQLERGERLWRARSRVERGDTALAEPLLVELFSESRHGTGETSLVVAEGLLRCRLARGEQVGAVIPALEVARLRRAGATTTSYSNLAPVLDEATSLVPALPPVLPAGPALDRLHTELDDIVKVPGGDPIVRALAAGYRAALVLDGSRVPAPGGAVPTLEVGEPKAVRDHPGAALLRAVLAANDPAAADEGAAAAGAGARLGAGRQKLAALAIDDAAAAWAESWRRFFAGTSLLQESQREQRRRGVVDLLHVTALSSAQQPWLSGVALMVASDALVRDGAAAAAATLRREFDLLHPHHALRAATAPPAAPGSKLGSSSGAQANGQSGADSGAKDGTP